MLMGCEGDNESEQFDEQAYYQVEVLDEGQARLFRQVLEANDLYYSSLEPTVLKLKLSEKNEADALFMRLVKNDIPKNRSISLAFPGLQTCIMKEFNAQGISFEIKERFNKTWIVWENSDTKITNSIITNCDSKVMDEFMEDLNG